MNAVNLIPIERRRTGATGMPGLPFFGLLAGLLAVLLASVLYIQAHESVSTKRAELTQVQVGVARWTTAAAKYAPYVSAAAQREKQLSNFDGLLDQRYDWSELLGQVAGVMPAQSELATISATAAGGSAAAAAGGSASASGIQISACAVSQSVVADTMVALQRMSGVSEVSLQSSSSSGSGGSGNCDLPVQFQLSLELGSPASAVTSPNSAATSTTASTSATGAAQ